MERLREGTRRGIAAVRAAGVRRGAARAIPVLPGGGPVKGHLPGGGRTRGGVVPCGAMGDATTGRVPRGTIGQGTRADPRGRHGAVNRCRLP